MEYPRKAMIFCAGLGTRFKPWTDKHPKALAMVNGKSLLQRNIEYLQQYDIFEVVVNVHHFPDQLIDAIEKNKGWGSQVTVSDERQSLLETGGGLLHAAPLLRDDRPFLTLNADILTNLDINKLVEFHAEKKALISFGITSRITSRNLLLDENSRLCGWENSATGEKRISRQTEKPVSMAYSCVAMFEQEVLDIIPQKGKFSLIDTYLDLARTRDIYGYDHSGDYLVDVGRPESVEAAEIIFK
ncbi:MAG: sugar phosphate nucleotidyltransferase [Ferruginibacter sp.]